MWSTLVGTLLMKPSWCIRNYFSSNRSRSPVDRKNKTCYYKHDFNLQGINNNVKRKSEMV